MSVAFYRTPNAFEFLPSVMYSYMEGKRQRDNIVIIAFLDFNIEITWEIRYNHD